MAIKIENAKIRSAIIQIESHGILTAFLDLHFGGGLYQGFGGFGFDYRPKKERIFTPACGHFIRKCLEIADVESWDQLVGKSIRVKRDEKWNSNIDAIGHITDDIWFEPKEEFKKYSK